MNSKTDIGADSLCTTTRYSSMSTYGCRPVSRRRWPRKRGKSSPRLHILTASFRLITISIRVVALTTSLLCEATEFVGDVGIYGCVDGENHDENNVSRDPTETNAVPVWADREITVRSAF